ncbi:MAG: hypothetical protein AABY46_08295 [Nitrospirota bacterium]
MAAREAAEIAAEIDALAPADRLRLAAELMEAGRLETARPIIHRVSVELGAILALTRNPK